MNLKFPNYPFLEWIRTCQECGHTQMARDPKTYAGESWRELKCRKCKSIALDYGQENDEVSEGLD